MLQDPANNEKQADAPPQVEDPTGQLAETVVQRGADDPWKTTGVPDAPPSELSKLAAYEILAEVGRGGMGVVYKARHKRLNRVVALKMILSGPHAGAETLARFRREADAIAQLQHPNLVQIYDVDDQDGRPFFALEFLDGGTLDERIAGQPQPIMQAAQTVEILAGAVHAVHQHGIVHRDLKPANILLSRDGTAKIGDFGLAKKMGEGGSTMTGDIVGTPSYMAPEQAAGKIRDIGPPTDVYSLGAILYAMLTGRPPFMAETTWDVVSQVISHEPVPPRQLQHKVPRDLETICLKCLNKDPRRRYATALELADDLRRFREGEPIKARPAGPITRMLKWARRHPTRASLFGVSALATLALLFVGAVYNARLQLALEDAQTKGDISYHRFVRLHVVNGSRLADDGDWFGALVWFTQALALEEDLPERAEMHRIRIGTFARHCPPLRQLMYHPHGVQCVAFSDDGRFLIVTGRDAGASLHDLSADSRTGTEQRFEPERKVTATAFSSARKLLATATAGGIRLWNPAGASPLKGPLEPAGPVRRMSFSTDGGLLLSVADGNEPALWNIAGGRRVPLSFSHQAVVNDAVFSPDASRIATASADKTTRLWRVADGRPLTSPLPHPAAVTRVCFSPDGRILATICTDRTVRLFAPQTGALLVTLQHRDTVNHVAFSRDSRWLVTACADGAARIWSVVDGRQHGLAMRHLSEVNRAEFSHDGMRVITASDDNTARLWDAATQEILPPLLPHHGTVECASFSPDGKWLVTASKDQLVRLWAVDSERLVPSSARRLPVRNQDGVPPWKTAAGLLSPDGRRVAKLIDRNAVRVWHKETGEPLGPALKHNSDILYVVFSPDSRQLMTAGDDNTARVWDPIAGELAEPPLRHQASVNWAAFSPHGRKAVTASFDRTARVWDVSTGDPLSPPLLHPCEVRQAAFAADGLWVITIGADNIERRWDIRPDTRSTAALVSHAQVLSGNHIDPVRGFLPLGSENVHKRWRQSR